MDIPKCKICGKEYILNPFALDNLPPGFASHIKYIPACECFEKFKDKELEEAERKRQAECIRNKVKKYRDISIIDSKFLMSTFKNADRDTKVMSLAEKFVEKFLAKGTTDVGIFLHGKVGTGKTFAAACIANELMDHNKTVLVMNLGLYLNKLKREWAEAENDVLNYVKTCDLLIIDDLGVENITDWVQDKVFALIDTRYRSGKPLILTTNLELDNSSLNKTEIENKLSIESRFNPRISNRIAEMCYSFSVEGKNYRQYGAKEKMKELLK